MSGGNTGILLLTSVIPHILIFYSSRLFSGLRMWIAAFLKDAIESGVSLRMAFFYLEATAGSSTEAGLNYSLSWLEVGSVMLTALTFRASRIRLGDEARSGADPRS